MKQAIVEKKQTGLDGAPSAADVKAVQEVITIPEVLQMLRAHVPNETITAEVKRRRIAQPIVDATELELAANGAGRNLLAALKDPNNMLTLQQEKAHSQLLGARTPPAKSVANSR